MYGLVLQYSPEGDGVRVDVRKAMGRCNVLVIVILLPRRSHSTKVGPRCGRQRLLPNRSWFGSRHSPTTAYV
jgi:hypothetical protein